MSYQISKLYEKIERLYLQIKGGTAGCCHGEQCPNAERPLFHTLDAKNWVEVSFYFNELCLLVERQGEQIAALQAQLAPKRLPPARQEIVIRGLQELFPEAEEQTR